MCSNYSKRSRGGGGGSGGGSGKQFHRNHSSDELEVDDQPKEEGFPLGQMFRQFQTEIDQRHDRYERLVKISRDITIESKRAIFLLHRIDSNESQEKILDEVQQKMDALRDAKWHQVALELQDEDPYKFLRAYSPGLQEYIEAMAFFHYIEKSTLLSLHQVQNSLTFSEGNSDCGGMEDENQRVLTASGKEKNESVGNTEMKVLSVHVPPIEYMLGLADLTGELMRLAIGCIGRGEFQKPFELCKFIQSVHNAFLSFGNQPREMFVKFSVLRQSMRKVEDACYALQVRGSEMPKHLLVDSLNSFVARPPSYETATDICLDYAE